MLFSPSESVPLPSLFPPESPEQMPLGLPGWHPPQLPRLPHGVVRHLTAGRTCAPEPRPSSLLGPGE